MRDGRAGIRRHHVRQALLPRRLHEQRVAVALRVPHRTRDETVAVNARPQRHRHGRIRHAELMDRAVCFGHLHDQVAAIAGRIQVVDFERTRGNRRFVDRHPVLTDLHLRVAVRHAPHDRRKAAHRVRQHPVVRRELHAAKLRRVEQLARRIRFADGELRLQRGEVAPRVGCDVLIACATARRPAIRALVTKMPRADVDAARQPDVALRERRAAAAAAAIQVRVVVQHANGHAVVPSLGTDVAARDATQRRLRNTEAQTLLAEFERRTRVGNRAIHFDARAIVAQPRQHARREPLHIDADRFQLRFVEARLCVGRLRRCTECNLHRGGEVFVHIYVDAVHAGRRRIPSFKP